MWLGPKKECMALLSAEKPWLAVDTITDDEGETYHGEVSTRQSVRQKINAPHIHPRVNLSGNQVAVGEFDSR